MQCSCFEFRETESKKTNKFLEVTKIISDSCKLTFPHWDYSFGIKFTLCLYVCLNILFDS